MQEVTNTCDGCEYKGHKFFRFNFFYKKNKLSTVVNAYFVNRFRLEKLDKVFFANLPNEMKLIYSLAKEPKLFRAMKNFQDSKPSLDCNKRKKCRLELFRLLENAKKIVKRQHQVMIETERKGEVDEGRRERDKDNKVVVVKHETIDLVSSSDDEKPSAKREADLSEDAQRESRKKRRLDVEDAKVGTLHKNDVGFEKNQEAVCFDRTTEQNGPSNFKCTRMRAADFFPASNLIDDEKENELCYLETDVVESDLSNDGAVTTVEERSSPNYDGDCEDEFDFLANQINFLRRFRKNEFDFLETDVVESDLSNDGVVTSVEERSSPNYDSDYFADDSSDID